MKILLNGINFSPELTGIGKYTGELAVYLMEAGHELRVVTAPPYYPQWRVLPGYSGWRYRRERIAGMVVYRCPLWVPVRLSGLNRLLHLASFAISSLLPMMLLSTWKPDVVISIAPALLSAPAALLSARLSGAKTWLHIQDFELEAAASFGMLPAYRQLGAIGRWLEAGLLRRFDRVSSLSEAMLARLAAKGVPEAARKLLPNWVDTRLIRPVAGVNCIRTELGISPQQTVVLYAGSMGHKQGLKVLIEAARQIVCPEIVFVVCGDGATRAGLIEQADGSSNIIFLPLQPFERLNDLLNLADIHVLPQLTGAADLVMPSKLSGMLSSGRPVIATAEPGTELHAVVSRVGRVVQPEDSQSLAIAIQNLAANQTERIHLGKLSRRFAEEHWDKSSVMERFVIELDRLIDPVQGLIAQGQSFNNERSATGLNSTSVRANGSVPGLKIRYPLMNRWLQLLKRCIDIALSVFGLVMLAPILGLITLMVKLGSPGPVFYLQKRLGKHGRVFEMLKFRTMYLNADQMLALYLAQNPEMKAEWNCHQKLVRDPRITPVGTLLRRFSLDELPQLWNVLVGDMSLVGPRPIMLGQRELYGENFQHYVRTQPGLTGLWQVSGRSDTSYADRVALDEYYVRHWSIWMDLYILFRTVWVVIKHSGAY